MDMDVSGVEGPVTGGQSCHVSAPIQNQEFSSTALLAGFPERDFFFGGVEGFLPLEGIEGMAGIAGTPGGRAMPPGMPPPFLICFIIFWAAENLSTSAFTSCTLRPDPEAMRARREPLRIFGSIRSCGVMD